MEIIRWRHSNVDYGPYNLDAILDFTGMYPVPKELWISLKEMYDEKPNSIGLQTLQEILNEPDYTLDEVSPFLSGMLFIHNDLENHPNMDNDPIYNQDIFRVWLNEKDLKSDQLKYGFISEEQENNWFNQEEKDLMIRCGFERKIYNIEEEFVFPLMSQCLFYDGVEINWK